MTTSRFANVFDDLHVRLFAAAFMRLELNTWSAQNVCDAFWRFYVNDRDGAQLKLKNKTFPLRAGVLYLVPEGVHFSCANSQAVGHFYLHFDVIGVPHPILQRWFNAPIEIENAPRMAREARMLRSELKAGRAFEIALQCRAKALLLGSLAHVFAHCQGQNVADYHRLSGLHEPVGAALEYIEKHLGDKIDNGVLARLCHWREDHFARRFGECVGQSPGRYVSSRRIALACRLLLFSQKSIEQIARECGFANRFHFSRAFKEAKKCAPAAYRKSAQV